MNGGQKYVHNFTNDIIYGKSLLDLSDKKVTEEKRTLSLIIELNI